MEKDEWVVLKYYKSKTGVTETYNEVEVNCALGKFRYKDSKKEININYSHAYPVIQPKIKGKCLYLRVHIAILSSSSIKLPITNGFVVDHKDRDKQNFELSNLRFVSYSENNKNRSHTKNNKIGILIKNNKVEYIYKNKNERFYQKFEQFKKNKSFDETFSMTEYTYDQIIKKNININIIDILNDTSWIKINDCDYEISNLGVVRIKRTYGYHYTVGTPNADGYLRQRIKDETKYVHSLVVKYFINKGKDFSSDLQVDHIDTNPLNNRIENLRLVTSKENINNKLTIEKKSIPIKCNYKGEKIYFKSYKDCSKFLSVLSSSIVSKWVRKTCTPSNPDYSDFENITDEELEDLKSGKLKFTKVP